MRQNVLFLERQDWQCFRGLKIVSGFLETQFSKRPNPECLSKNSSSGGGWEALTRVSKEVPPAGRSLRDSGHNLEPIGPLTFLSQLIAFLETVVSILL